LTPERLESIKTILQPIIDAIQRKTELNLNRGRPVDLAGVVMQYLRINFDKAVTLTDMASLLSVSPSRAGHAIKELFGKTLKELLVQTRITRVLTLLQTTDYAIERIALMTGFVSAGYLHRIFRRETGLPPVAYRKQFQQKYHSALSKQHGQGDGPSP